MSKKLVCDTGGSKTILEILDEENNVVKKFIDKGFGLASDGLEEILELNNLLSLIENPNEIKYIVINLGGKNKEQIKNHFQKVFVNAKINIFRESEGNVSKALAKMFNSEVVVLAGTGAISCGFSGDEKAVVCGGWGMNISDQGSGYYIGMEAIKQSLLELDGSKQLSLLTKTLTGQNEPLSCVTDINIIAEVRDSVRKKLYPLSRENIAKHAKTTLECAQKGDKVSIDILGLAGAELGKLAVRTAEKLSLKKLNGVVFTGGIINSKKFIEKSLEKEIYKVYGQVKITYLTDGVIEGIRYIAKKAN